MTRPLTTKEAAAWLGVHVNTLLAWAKRKRLHPSILGARTWRWSEADLAALLQKRKV